jgi:pimeloyl-ACP methyl ester carboxylesterase
MKQILIDGLLSSYSESGEGKPLLMLHGWGCNANIFRELQAEMSKSFRVLAVDFPGFGGSDEPNSVWNCANYADWLEKFMRKTGIENPSVLAHSFGGRIALKLSANIQFSKIILTGSAGLILKRKKTNFLKYMPNFLKKGFIRKVLINIFGSVDYKNASPRMREILKRVVAEDLEQYARKISAPTLLVWGEKDGDTTLEMGKKFNEIIPNSRLEIIKNSGHYAFLDNKNEFINIVNNFTKD